VLAAAVRWATEAVLYYIVALAGWGLFGVVAAVLAVSAAAAGLYLLRHIGQAGGYRLALAATGVGALGLATRRDLHGAALTFAMVLMAVLLAHRRHSCRAVRPSGIAPFVAESPASDACD
jgi:hypothetical protein